MQKRRTAVLYIIMIAMMVFVIIRLYAVMSYGKASQVLSGQYTRRIDAVERRGFIYDRNGIALNMREDGYICLVNPACCKDMTEVSERISEVSSYSQSEIYDRLLKNIPFTVRTDSEPCAEGTYSYPIYVNETVCAPHIVGYTDGSGKGVSGIEKYFDGTLSGKFAGEVSFRYMSDAVGAVLENTGSCIYDSGYGERSGIYLTIDSELQQFCSELAQGFGGSGAVCVTDTASGEVLACVSFPEFDTKKVAEYLDSEKGELVNRCTSGFTPGSMFKTVTAAAALETDAELYLSEYECTGSIETEDGEVIPCHNKDGHGVIDMKTAYAQSCNPYFINLASVVGEEKIRETAELMGLSEGCSLDRIFGYGSSIPVYDGEVSSFGGYLANLAIGQGKTLVSPISACTLYSCAVTGKRTEPGIMLKICGGDTTVRDYTNLRSSEYVLSEKTVEYLTEMMLCCVEDGLGKEAKPEIGTAGGKTATAQTGSFDGDKEILNCWFCGVYPGDEPKYTVCVLYSGTDNGDAAKAIFREICDKLAVYG